MDGEKSTGKASRGPQKSGVKKQKTGLGPANLSSKVIIVQSIPSNVVSISNYLKDPNTIKQIYVKELTKVFSVYGRVSTCDVCMHYLTGVETFAHITYASRNSTVKAQMAAANREVKMNGCILTVTPVSEGRAPIDILNEHCLTTVFSLVENRDRVHIERVCKRWRDLAPKSWYNVKEFDCTVYTTKERVGYLKRCGRYLITLTSPALPSYLSSIQEYCSKVENLTATYYSGEYKNQLRDVIEKLTKLNTLVVELSYNSFDGSITDTLPASMEEIQLISSPWFKFLTGKLIDQNFSRFRNLQKLVINRLIIENSSITGLETLQNLTHLDINDTGGNVEIFNQIQRLKNLKFLAISHYSISDNCLINIVTSNRNLEYLDISYTKSLTEESVVAVSKLPNLKSLKMALVGNISLLSLDAMPNLEFLDCDFCRAIGEAGLEKVINSSPVLTYLNIRECDVSWDLFDIIGKATETRDSGVTLTVATEKSVRLSRPYPLLIINRLSALFGDGGDSYSSHSSSDFYYDVNLETDSEDDFETLDSCSESEPEDDD